MLVDTFRCRCQEELFLERRSWSDRASVFCRDGDNLTRELGIDNRHFAMLDDGNLFERRRCPDVNMTLGSKTRHADRRSLARTLKPWTVFLELLLMMTLAVTWSPW